MFKVYILIITLSQGALQGGNSTIIAEFNSQEKCKIALNNQMEQLSLNGTTKVVSSGCYEK